MTLRTTIDAVAVESPSLPRAAYAGVTDGHRAGPSEMVADMFPGAFANPALFGEDSMIFSICEMALNFRAISH